MICTSIQNKDFGQILDILQDPHVEMAEIRLDLCPLKDKEIEELFSDSDKPLVATCRIAELARGGAAAEKEAERRLSIAIQAGARFADLELEASAEFSKRFRALCHECGTEIIRSWHDFDGTPDLEYLKMITARCFRYGADIAKVVTTCRNASDAARILALYGGDEPLPYEPTRLIAFGMGEEGHATRIECLKLGAPFSYASLNQEEATAPGQIPVDEMHRIIYEGAASPAGYTHQGLPAPGGFFRNSLTVPASKSFAQRAIIAAALAEGRSHLRRYTPCADSESAIEVAKAIGAKVRLDGSTLTIDGIGASLPATGRPLHLSRIHTGESGLLTRLLIPLLAVLNEGPVTITGEKTLEHRPLKGVSDIMASFGVVVKENKVPITIDGNIIPGTAEISGKDGSQLISGLLAALPFCPKPSTLLISEPKSIPYMFITCDILKRFGIRISSEMEGDAAMIEEQDWSACTGITFKIKGGQRYHAADIDLEGDWSAAANFLVAGAIFGSAEMEGLNTDSIQADLAIADILVQAGAIVSELDDTICVRKAPLEGFEADLNNAPDLFPIVSVLAAFCAGESRISGLGRLVGKESNRAEAILEMLTQMGVPARADGDDLVVEGETLASRLLNDRLLRGGLYSSHGDHRMAMALKVASIGAAPDLASERTSTGPIVIDNRECVSKSFPDFFESFDF